jgi:hypothetical protein
MKWAPKIVFIALLTGFISTACKKKTCEEVIPEMEYLDFNYRAFGADSGNYILTFKFNDCDGDIGMNPTDTIVDEFGEKQTTNFKIDIYYVANDQWVKHVFGPDDAGLDAKIPVLGNSTLNPVLDGEIDKKIHPSTFAVLGYDSIMFKSKILDNAGHYSNEVETPGFIIMP